MSMKSVPAAGAYRVMNLIFNDDGFVFDSATGDSYVANPTGVRILRALQDGRSETEIVGELTQQFVVDAEDARRDLADFISRLKLLQLA